MAAGEPVGWVPVEHHAFVYRGQSLAFNVNTLEVHRLNEEQLRLLRFSSEVQSLEDRCAGGSPVGLSPRRVNDVLKALRDMGLVVPEGTPIPEARRPAMAYDYTFMVNVAQICNLRCLYCYTQEGRFDFTGGQRTRMIPDDAKRLALAVRRWFPQATVTCFHFYGGEPLINFPAIQALVEETRSNEQPCCYEFAITTNGTLLTPRIADFLDEHRFTVFLSIDGPARIHDQARIFGDGRGSFDVVKQNLDYLLTKRNVKLLGSSVIRCGWTLPEAMRFLTSLGVDGFKAERVRARECEPLALTPEQQQAYLEDLDALFEIYLGALEQNRKPLDYRLSPKLLQLWTRTRRTHFCPAGKRMFGVTAEGDIYPCSLHSGRARSQLGTIAEGLHPGKVQAFRQRTSAAGQHRCRTCWSRYLCGGGCSAMIDRFGQEDCDVLRKKAEIAIAIYDEVTHRDPLNLLNLVSPVTARWLGGDVQGADGHAG
jgi:uncharacterized protein